MNTLKVLSVLILVGAVCGQQNGYSYPKPQRPNGQYLPPQEATTQPPRPPTETQENIESDSITPDRPSGSPDSGSSAPAEEDHAPGMPYDFGYEVKDGSGNDYSHKAESDGETVRGEYRVLLPDSRVQIVRYTADWKNGYQAEVTYEGEAQYPEEAPRPTQGPQGPSRPNEESQSDIDSQGLQPTPQPTYRPQPTTTYRPAPTTQPPPPPNGLYGAPNVPFGVRMNPKFGYNRKREAKNHFF